MFGFKCLVVLGIMCLSAFNSNIQEEDVELENIKVALGLAAEALTDSKLTISET
jgi:hypothetical protein